MPDPQTQDGGAGNGQQADPAAVFQQLTFPSGPEFYDWLMGQIEPDLVTAMIPALPEKYTDETAEQKTARGERYAKAFAEYDRQFSEYARAFEDRVRKAGKDLKLAVEDDERQTSEQKVLGDLESAMSQGAA